MTRTEEILQEISERKYISNLSASSAYEQFLSLNKLAIYLAHLEARVEALEGKVTSPFPVPTKEN